MMQSLLVADFHKQKKNMYCFAGTSAKIYITVNNSIIL